MNENNCLAKDVVVIGAGPAGSMCAYLLKKAGVECVLIDRATFPREKVCGGSLTHKAYTLLAETMPDLKYDYYPVRKLKLMIGSKTVSDFEPTEELRIVHRKDFDFALLQQYQRIGGEFVQDAFSAYEEQADGRILVTLKSGVQYLCRYLVGADGANSRVRRQAKGTYHGNVLCMEQYVEKTKDCMEVSLSSEYNGGYYYWFPGPDHDIVGYGDKQLTPAMFRNMMERFGVKETKIKGAYVPVEEVETDNDHIILIGDAGGFPNKLTYEGIYYALATGRNASIAIIEGKPFRETNRLIFKKKRMERTIARLMYDSPWGIRIVRLCSVSSRFVRLIFDAGV